MKKYTLVLGALFGLFLFVGDGIQAQKGLLWEITDPNGKTSFLFGTYHLVGSEYLDVHTPVASAYASSETVVVETLIDSSKLMQVATMSMMTENTLWDFYDTVQFESIDSEFKDVTGMSLTSMTQMKPIAIAMFYSLSIAQQELAKSELNFSGLPIDLYFAQQAGKSGKEVVPLETMMEQMDMLYNSDPLEEQAEMLLEMINDTTVEDISIALLDYYEAENLEAMAKLSEEVGNDYGDMAVLLDNRNNKWIDQLKPILAKGDAFIAVGALHLPGEEGLLVLLTEEGYKLSPVEKSSDK